MQVISYIFRGWRMYLWAYQIVQCVVRSHYCSDVYIVLIFFLLRLAIIISKWLHDIFTCTHYSHPVLLQKMKKWVIYNLSSDIVFFQFLNGVGSKQKIQNSKQVIITFFSLKFIFPLLCPTQDIFLNVVLHYVALFISFSLRFQWSHKKLIIMYIHSPSGHLISTKKNITYHTIDV